MAEEQQRAAIAYVAITHGLHCAVSVLVSVRLAIPGEKRRG